MFQPKSIEFYEQGLEFLAEEKFNQALDALKEAVKIEPGFADAHMGLAITYHSLNLFQEAYEEYEIVLKLRPDDVGVLNNIGVLSLELKDYEAARKFFEEALKFYPNCYLTHLNLAFLHYKKGDIAKVVEHKEKAEKNFGNFKGPNLIPYRKKHNS